MDFYVQLKNTKSMKRSTTVSKTGECSICFETVSKNKDNIIRCGKVSHTICKDCKFRMNEDKDAICPMCRSHPLQMPISSESVMNITSTRMKSKDSSSKKYTESFLTPKQRKFKRRSESADPLPNVSNNKYWKSRRDYVWKSYDDNFHHFSGWRGANGEYITNSFLERWHSEYIEIGVENGYIQLQHIDTGEIILGEVV